MVSMVSALSEECIGSAHLPQEELLVPPWIQMSSCCKFVLAVGTITAVYTRFVLSSFVLAAWNFLEHQTKLLQYMY